MLVPPYHRCSPSSQWNHLSASRAVGARITFVTPRYLLAVGRLSSENRVRSIIYTSSCSLVPRQNGLFVC